MKANLTMGLSYLSGLVWLIIALLVIWGSLSIEYSYDVIVLLVVGLGCTVYGTLSLFNSYKKFQGYGFLLGSIAILLMFYFVYGM